MNQYDPTGQTKDKCRQEWQLRKLLLKSNINHHEAMKVGALTVAVGTTFLLAGFAAGMNSTDCYSCLDLSTGIGKVIVFHLGGLAALPVLSCWVAEQAAYKTKKLKKELKDLIARRP